MMLARGSLLTLLFVALLSTFAAARPVPIAERGLIKDIFSGVESSCTSGGILSFVFALFNSSCGTKPWLGKSTDGSTVKTPLGTVKGSSGLRGFAFTLPYATSERWELSKPVPAWSGTLDGTKLPASCPQSSSFVASADMSEDCLDLVVYAPNGAANLDNVPVFVWIHGGSFVSGSASAPGLDAREFARANNVIVVVIQYRLGIFGLLPPASAPVSTPNLALADVITSLKFIKKIIPSFGGSASTITVAGQSSGAHMIRGLLASPKAKGLFQRAILQSDPMSFGMSTPATTAIVQDAFYGAIDQQVGQTLDYNTLKNVNWTTLVAAQAAFTPQAFYLDDGIPVAEPIRPTASSSDAYLPSDFGVALAAGKLPSWSLATQLLFTTVADEFASADGTLNPAPPPSAAYANEVKTFIADTDKQNAILGSPTYALGTGDDAVRDALNKVGTEGFWTCATRYMADLWTKAGGKVYVAEFGLGAPYPDNQAIAYCNGKVCHEDDIFITFGTTPYSLVSAGRVVLTQEVMTRWGNFAAQNTRSPWYKSTKWNTYSSEADVLPLGQTSITRTCPAGFWGTAPALFDWQLYSA